MGRLSPQALQLQKKKKKYYFCECAKLEWILPKMFHPCGSILLLRHQSLLPLVRRTGSSGRRRGGNRPGAVSTGLQYPKRWFCFCFSKRLKIDHSLSSPWPLNGIFERILSLVPENGSHSDVFLKKKKERKNLSVKITGQIVRVLWGSLATVTLLHPLSNNGMLEQEGRNPTTQLCPETLHRTFALPGIFSLTLFTWHPFKELSDEVGLGPKET